MKGRVTALTNRGSILEDASNCTVLNEWECKVKELLLVMTRIISIYGSSVIESLRRANCGYQ